MASLQEAEDLFRGSISADQQQANGNPLTGPATTEAANIFFSAENTVSDFVRFALIVVGGIWAYRILRGVK